MQGSYWLTGWLSNQSKLFVAQPDQEFYTGPENTFKMYMRTTKSQKLFPFLRIFLQIKLKLSVPVSAVIWD